MPNYPEDEAAHERFVNADLEPSRDELAREVLDGPDLEEYLEQKRVGLR